jgi:hypothetical protein
MKTRMTMVAAAIGALFASSAFAQSTETEVQRNVDQQQRIEQGLQSGALNTREAAKLEAGEARINRMESNALKDGTLTNSEKARINKAQNAESRAINRQKHDAQTGNPQSASSQRMQAAVQRNVDQQKRIEHGARSGSLTNQETAKLERGAAHVERKEARAGIDGHVSAAGSASIQHAQDGQRARIYRNKHNVAAK